MNIPLINTNDKESINTSLIAIKRATEELNNLIKIADEKMAQLDEKAKKYTDDKINALDVSSVGGSGKYISAISETDGKISATEGDITSTVSSGNSQPVTSGGVAEAIAEVTPTYPIAVNKGGTGQTTALAVVNETIQSGIGLGDAVFEDTTDIVTSHVMGYSTSYKGLYRRKASLLWSYISSKITNWLDTVVTKNSSNPITSGGVANSFSYIKGEIETGGTWIDGKKIYRRVADFTLAEITSGNTSYTLSSDFWSNIDSLVSMRILRPKHGILTFAEISLPLRYDIPSKTLSIYNNPVSWTGPFLLVCEYTKP